MAIALRVPQASRRVLAAGPRLLAHDHLDDMLVPAHFQLCDFAVDRVRDLLGPFGCVRARVGLVWKEWVV